MSMSVFGCRYNTRCASAVIAEVQATKAMNSKRYEMIGACMKKHVAHGEFVSKLEPGTVIEVCEGGQWSLATVLLCRYDGGATFLRHIKVCIYAIT